MSFSTMLTQISLGMLNSLKIFSLTLIFALPLGLLVSFGRMSRYRIVKTIVRLYISIMRGTPLMLQLFVVYYCPYYLFRIPLSSGYRFWAIIIGFTVNYAAYFAEIYRGEFNPSRWGSTKRQRCWDIAVFKHFGRSSFRRPSSASSRL